MPGGPMMNPLYSDDENADTPTLGEFMSREGTPENQEEVDLQAAEAGREYANTSTSAGAASAELRDFFKNMNIDIDDPNVQIWLQSIGTSDRERLNWLKNSEDITVRMVLTAWQESAPAVPVTQYQQATAELGFEEQSTGGGNQFDLARGLGGAARPGIVEPTTGVDREYSDTSGATRYSNGTIVTQDGQIIYDPAGNAPGSQRWLMDAAQTWGSDKIRQWKDRLTQFGYLTKDEAKGDDFDVMFGQALQEYHTARYLYGGKAVPKAGGGPGAGLGPVMDMKDISVQIRNDVREQYTRVYGVEPSEEEVRHWTQSIIRMGMDEQRRLRGKGNASFVSTGIQNAEEGFIEQIEQSPKARMLRDSAEENTSLHDAIQSAIYVTQGLAG